MDETPETGPSDPANPPGNAGSLFVVGIGASAGGIAALRSFFSHVSPASGMAYVVILHLSPQHESNLPFLLQTQTAIPVTQVTASIKVEPNHIYVIPPSQYLVLMDGMIELAEPERSHGSPTSIDLLFRTLAGGYGKNALAIVLSGSGSDGTIGVGRIKEAGGFTIAQDPAEAEYPDMPRNAINTGLVDLVMTVAAMPDKLLALRESAERLDGLPRPEEAPHAFDQNSVEEVLTLLRVRTGHDFSHYRRPTVFRRILRRMQVHDLRTLEPYLILLREQPEEVSALLRELLISVTNFFRDREAFAWIEQNLAKRLFAGKGANDQVRVWSAGCATGEEAYSLAMVLADYASQMAEPPKVQIFATDIDEPAIARARDGRYAKSIGLDVTPERLRHYFLNDEGHYQVKKELRELVLFAPHNLLRDPPFSKLDLISCRNLLIYLNREMQERVLALFHFALRPEGFLFLGASESAELAPALFAAADQKHRIYARRAGTGFVRPPSSLIPGHWPAKGSGLLAPGAADLRSAGELHQVIVERLAPPSVLINAEYDILHMSARAGRYLRFAGGEPSHNLLKVIHPDLRLGLRAALLAAESKAETPSVAPRRMTAVIDGAPRQVALTVRPVIEGGPEAGFFLVLFDESVAAAPTSPEAERERDPAETPPASGEAEQIEEDLQRTKDLLRLTIEQYETSTEELRASNEELQAINEELRSATEELETSKEELQSLNEELTTVNQEYREKIEEVGRTNSDLQNLMASTDIGTIFLDRGLRIKRYTPHAQGLFNITLADIGRPLDHFTHRLDYGTLTADAESVLRTLQALEREVHGSDGRWYLARLAPYRTLDDKIDGVVLSFVDVTGHHEAEEQLRRQAARLNQQAEIVSQAHVLMLDPDDRIILWNEGCERMYGYTSKEAIGQVASTLLKTEFPQPLAEIKDQLERTGEWEGEMTQQVRWGARIVVASHWTLHRGEGNGDRPAILEVNNDVTARHDAERALREADRNKGWFLAMLAHELRNPLNALLSSVELLERPDVDASDTSLATGILHRQLQLLMRLVDDLLDIERLNHGKIVLSRKRVELASVIDAAIETCKPLIDASRHDFKVTLPAEPIILDADPVRLAQVFANLLHNAIKFTPAGGNIMVNAERSGEDVIVRVADNGIGVEPGMLPRLFEMYEQSTPVSGTEFGGLGVGLALVRQLTEMHGGAVAARSDGPGKGAEFVVRLPIIHPAEAEHPQ